MNGNKKEDHLCTFKNIDYRKIPGGIHGITEVIEEEKESFIDDVHTETLIKDKIVSIVIYDKEVKVETKNSGTYYIRYIKGHMILNKD